MRKLYLLLILLLIPTVNASSDCEYFVLPELGINSYQLCLQNPSNYSQYFVYHDVYFYDGTTLLKTDSVRDGSSAVAPSSPSKSGYTFTGWSRSFSNVTSDLTVYAQFDVAGYSVTYKDYNGNTLKQETVAEGGNGTPPSVSRTGYTFTGWSDSYINVTSNRTLFASYTVKTYTVRFFDYFSNVIKTQTVQYNYSASPPSAPAVLGHSFIGWSSSYTQVRSSLDIYAEYDADTYTVTFMADDVVKTEEVEYNKAASAPIVSKPGFRFIGWDSSFDTIVRDTIVTAIFEPDSYTVVFLDEVGNPIHTEIVSYLGEATPPDISIEGMDFLGWDGNYRDITSDVTISPLFSVTLFDVTYIDFDGSVYATEQVEYGASCMSVTPVREGYTFTGLSEDCSMVTSDLALSILYEPTLLRVMFMYMDTILSEQLVPYGECAIEPDFSLNGHSLLGWNSELCNVLSDLTLTPILDKDSFSVTFKDYDGSTIETLEVLYGETASIMQPSRVGYRFVSWSDSLIITNNITLFAEYARNEYKVEFYYGELLLEEITVKHGESVEPPEFEFDGIEFIGWDKSLDYIQSNLVVNADTTIKEYTVVLKDYDMRTINTLIIKHGQDVTTPELSREGFEFIGWSDSTLDIRNDITLIAKYEPKSILVQFIVDDSVIGTQLVKYGSKPDYPEGYDFEDVFIYHAQDIVGTAKECFNAYYDINNDLISNVLCEETVDAPLVEGYTFLEWQDTESGIYPIYEKKSFTVRFIYGDIIEEQRVQYGNAAVAPASLSGFSMDSWDKSFEFVSSDLDVYGYFEPEDKPEMKMTRKDHLYTLKFKQDMSEFSISYFIINGEMRSTHTVLFELDKTSFFDKKMNYVNITLEPGETLDEVCFENSIQYIYKLDVEEEISIFQKVINWIKTIF